MRHFRRYGALIFGSLFAFSLTLTLLISLLRGFGLLRNLPGSILLFFIVTAIVAGIIFGIEQTKT